MARQKLQINKSELQEVITKLENSQTFDNPSALWKAVEATDYAKTQQPRPLTAATAYLRAKQFGIIIKTQSKGRGIGSLSEEQKKAMQEARKTRRPRSEKMKEFSETFEKLRKKVPARWQNLLVKAEQGSLKAAIALNCLECTAYQASEIKDCNIIGCPMFPHRPYKNKESEEEEEKEIGDEETGDD